MQPRNHLERWKALVKVDVNQAASDFCDQSPEDAAEMAGDLGLPFMASLLSRLETDVAAEILRMFDDAFRNKILAKLHPEKEKLLREVLSYRRDTAGALMAKEFLSVPVDYSIGQATDYLQKIPKDKKGKVSYIYVVDKNNRLEGVIQIRDIVFHSPDTSIREILKSPVVQVETDMSQLDAAKLMQRHRYLGLPVVNHGQQLVGVISADAAMQAMEKEVSDDIAKSVGTSAEEIRTHSATRIVFVRLPWLLVNIAGGLLCAFISGLFQNNVQTIVALFLFVPVVLGLSESAGVQGATIVVRNLALGNIDFLQWRSLFFREMLAGIIIGSACGIIVGATGSFWQANPFLGAALASSMTLAIFVSTLLGLSMPLLFKRLKIDPAIASGPLVLAVCDIQTLIIYFNLSSIILARSAVR